MIKLELWQSLLLWGGIAGAYLGWRYFFKAKPKRK